MEGSKEFSTEKKFPQRSPSAGKPILQFDPTMPACFTDLLDTFVTYAGKGGKFLIVKESEDGITVAGTVNLQQLSDKNYVHTQSTASALWTVTHNLNKYPAVRIKDITGHSIIGDIVDININELTIEFTNPQEGTAIIN